MFLFLILDENIGNLVSNNYNWHKNNLFFGIQSKKNCPLFPFYCIFYHLCVVFKKTEEISPL